MCGCAAHSAPSPSRASVVLFVVSAVSRRKVPDCGLKCPTCACVRAFLVCTSVSISRANNSIARVRVCFVCCASSFEPGRPERIITDLSLKARVASIIVPSEPPTCGRTRVQCTHAVLVLPSLPRCSAQFHPAAPQRGCIRDCDNSPDLPSLSIALRYFRHPVCAYFRITRGGYTIAAPRRLCKCVIVRGQTDTETTTLVCVCVQWKRDSNRRVSAAVNPLLTHSSGYFFCVGSAPARLPTVSL